MKIVIYILFTITISSSSAGLLGVPAISSQDNSIQSVPNNGVYGETAYFGNYQPTGQLAVKYLPTTTTRGYSTTPLYMRFGLGNYVTNGLLGSVPVTNPIPAPLATHLPAYMYGAPWISSPPKYLRIIQRPGSIADAYRPSTNYMATAPKYFGVLPFTAPPNYYNNVNSINNPSIKSLRPVPNPIPSVPTTAPQPLDSDTSSRNHYQMPRNYNGPSANPESSFSSNPNPQTQTFTITNYGGGMTRISGVNGLSPEITNAIMKILQDPSSPPGSVTHIAAPDPSNSYLNGADAHSNVLSNTIDNLPSAATNQNVQITKPIEIGSTYSDHSHQNGIPTIARNFGKFGNRLQIHCDDDSVNRNIRNYRLRRPNPLYQTTQHHQFHRFLPHIRHQPQNNPQHSYQHQNQQQQQQQNLASSSYDDADDTISQVQTNLNTETNEVVSESSNVPDSEARFLQFINKE